MEFWAEPEKEGWLQSQGDHLRTWRRRWFVLKDGFLFRFGSADVAPASKPRGVVDLSKARARPVCGAAPVAAQGAASAVPPRYAAGHVAVSAQTAPSRLARPAARALV